MRQSGVDVYDGSGKGKKECWAIDVPEINKSSPYFLRHPSNTAVETYLSVLYL